MMTAGQNEDWAESLIQSAELERLNRPLWIQVAEPIDGIVLAAVGFGHAGSGRAVPDDQVMWRIPREQNHLHQGDMSEAIRHLDASMHPSTVVLGASHQSFAAARY